MQISLNVWGVFFPPFRPSSNISCLLEFYWLRISQIRSESDQSAFEKASFISLHTGSQIPCGINMNEKKLNLKKLNWNDLTVM